MNKICVALFDRLSVLLCQVIDCTVISPALDGVIMVIDTTHNSYKLERRMKQQLENPAPSFRTSSSTG